MEARGYVTIKISRRPPGVTTCGSASTGMTKTINRVLMTAVAGQTSLGSATFATPSGLASQAFLPTTSTGSKRETVSTAGASVCMAGLFMPGRVPTAPKVSCSPSLRR